MKLKKNDIKLQKKKTRKLLEKSKKSYQIHNYSLYYQ